MQKENYELDFRGPNLFVIISCFSIAAYVLFKLSVYPVSKLHLEVIFILFFLGGIYSRPWQLKHDVAIRLIVLGVFLPLIFFIFNYWSDSSLAAKYFSLDKLVKLMGFSAIGFWLGGSLKNIYIFLSIVFLGLIVALFNVDTVEALKQIFSGERVDFDIHNAQHTAMYFGLAIIAFLSFYKDLLISQLAKKVKLLSTLIFMCALTVVTIVFIGAQTRASILAMDIAFVLSVVHFVIHYFKKGSDKSIIILFLIYLFLASIVLSFSTNNVLIKRGSEPLVTKNLLEGKTKNIAMTSLGVRVNTWIEAGKWIKEKPLHGWGGRVRTHVIQDSNFSDDIKEHYGHFHNSYVEFTLAYGLIGLLYVLFIYYWVNKHIYLLSSHSARYRGVWYFTLYGSVFMAIINVFESYIFFRSGVYATAVLLAPAYSLYLSNIYNSLKKHNEI